MRTDHGYRNRPETTPVGKGKPINENVSTAKGLGGNINAKGVHRDGAAARGKTKGKLV